jgi:hypothetical protein
LLSRGKRTTSETQKRAGGGEGDALFDLDATDASEGEFSLFAPSLSKQPARRIGEEQDSDAENESPELWRNVVSLCRRRRNSAGEEEGKEEETETHHVQANDDPPGSAAFVEVALYMKEESVD